MHYFYENWHIWVFGYDKSIAGWCQAKILTEMVQNGFQIQDGRRLSKFLHINDLTIIFKDNWDPSMKDSSETNDK